MIREYWAKWYRKVTAPVAMGRKESYRRAVAFLDLPGAVLEDWGGGTGYARRYVKRARYRLVDGTGNQWCEVRADLTSYQSEVDCILLRHVLEHNDDWALILGNAVRSYRRRLCVVIYRPLADKTEREAGKSKVPIYHFALQDLVHIAGPPTHSERVGVETLFYWERP